MLIWKAFQNTEEWHFSFWNTFFRFRDIDIFLLCKLDSDDVTRFATEKWKILNKRYLRKYWSSVLETWQHNCASQKERNDTLTSVAIATISAPGSFCQKTKYPHLQPLKWDKGSYLKIHSSHVVLTSINRLGGVDGFCFKTKLRIFVFIDTPSAAKLLSWQQQ